MFFVLFGLAIVGSIAIMPYAFAMNKDKLAEAPLSTHQLMLVAVIQSIVLFGIVTFLGLRAADAVGLSVHSSVDIFPLAVILGILGTVFLIAIEVNVFHPRIPDALKQANHKIALWKRAIASLYGGINEELLTRLFMVSGIVWLLQQAGVSSDTVFWIAIFGAAILFGIGHLPATAAMTRLTPIIIVRAIVLNGIIGVICGWLFWQHGLVAAMVAHFSADIILHVISPMFIQPEDTPAAVQTI